MTHNTKECPSCGLRRVVSLVLMETAYQAFIMDLNKADTLDERDKFITFLGATGADGILYTRMRATGNRPELWRTRVYN